MKTKNYRIVAVIVGLIVMSAAGLVYSNRSSAIINSGVEAEGGAGGLNLTANLVQENILSGGEGIFEMTFELTAPENIVMNDLSVKNVDMVLVLDRSGSMQGKKMIYAKQAVSELLSLLTPNDRLSLISYSDGVHKQSQLVKITSENRRRLHRHVHTIQAGGGTNLGAGLKTGLDTILTESRENAIRKVILISDGMANKGVVDPMALGRMASIALEKDFSVATIGVGDSFNEQLMTHIADQGAGTYHYLENPDAFAGVIEREFRRSRQVAATSLEIFVPRIKGVMLKSAGGFTIKEQSDGYTIYPGNLLSGQSRKVFLTFQASAEPGRKYTIDEIRTGYISQGQQFRQRLEKTFTISCVETKKAVLGSIHKKSWEDKVLLEDYNRLREDVALDVKSGDKEKAIQKIDAYYQQKKQLNETVQSGKVEENLEQDVSDLKTMVRDTFKGAPAAVSQKQKTNAKSLQYEGYSKRRSKN